MKTIYPILGMVAFIAYIFMYIQTRIPHIPLLMFAMYFSILYKLEGKK